MLRIALSALLVLAACQKDKGGDNQTEPAGQSGEGAAKTANPQRNLGPQKPSPIKLPAPEDVAAPPADAKKTKSGLAYKVLEKGAGGAEAVHPLPEDKVKVNYTGWTTDGKMFDSSVTRHHPAEFRLDRVIPGWTEGLGLMTKGDKFRLWIPEELAYKGKPGRPQGMLVFDVELLDITPAPRPPEDVAKPPANAKKTPKGVFYKVLASGQGGDKPRAWDRVQVHYTGWTTDGAMFDSSVQRGHPATFSVSGVIPGWTDALMQMHKGDKWRVWIPEELAYKGKPGRPQGMLVFDVELLDIQKMPEPPPVPKDVAKPPKDAKKTAKGVYYKILEKGKGGQKPTAQSRVTVHYTGWTTDGKMFDSSVTRGKPATFSLAGVIPGWTDGLQQMSVGDKARLWIPEELAYKGKAGAPQGMLVFDVELLEVK